MSSTYNEPPDINDELALSSLRINVPAAPPHPELSLTPPQPAGPPPFLRIGCPGCSYSCIATGAWSPYQHERTGTWLRVWYFSATCPNCQLGTERPFSVCLSTSLEAGKSQAFFQKEQTR